MGVSPQKNDTPTHPSARDFPTPLSGQSRNDPRNDSARKNTQKILCRVFVGSFLFGKRYPFPKRNDRPKTPGGFFCVIFWVPSFLDHSGSRIVSRDGILRISRGSSTRLGEPRSPCRTESRGGSALARVDFRPLWLHGPLRPRPPVASAVRTRPSRERQWLPNATVRTRPSRERQWLPNGTVRTLPSRERQWLPDDALATSPVVSLIKTPVVCCPPAGGLPHAERNTTSKPRL